MKNELTDLLAERVALLSYDEFKTNRVEAQDAFIVVAAPEEETRDRRDSKPADDSVLIDFDYDNEDDTNFNVFLTIKYLWNDWNPLFNEPF